MKVTELVKNLEDTKGLMESVIQQHSASNSDILRQIESISRQMKGVQSHLQEQDKNNLKYEPMLKAFNESQNYKMVWTDTGIKIKKVANWVMVVGGALTSVWIVFKYIIKLAK